MITIAIATSLLFTSSSMDSKGGLIDHQTQLRFSNKIVTTQKLAAKHAPRASQALYRNHPGKVDFYRIDQLMASLPTVQYDQDQQEGQKADRDAAREAEKAGKEVAKAMAKAGPEIERALREIAPQIKREMVKMKPEIQRALHEARIQMEKARREHPEAYKREMTHARAEMKEGIEKAMIEMSRATKEMDNKDFKEMDHDGKLRQLIQRAMQEAAKAMKDTMESGGKALEDKN